MHQDEISLLLGENGTCVFLKFSFHFHAEISKGRRCEGRQEQLHEDGSDPRLVRHRLSRAVVAPGRFYVLVVRGNATHRHH